MSLTYKELYNRVLLRVNDSSGRASLAAKEAVNDAHRYIARAKDFDELIVLDTTNALTVVGQKTYTLEVGGWGLTRPKDILSLRYMDTNNSRKLVYVPPRTLDEYLPYPEGSGNQSPRWYTRRGESVELIPVPDAIKSIYVLYSQWPLPLTADSDTSSFDDELRDVIVALSVDLTQAILGGGGSQGNWVQRARELLGLATNEEEERPDRTFIASPFSPGEFPMGEYWKDPFVRRNP